jgi:hypothetical protein
MQLSDATQALLNQAFVDEDAADGGDSDVSHHQQLVIDSQNALAKEQGDLNTSLQSSANLHSTAKDSAMAALRAIATELKIPFPA